MGWIECHGGDHSKQSIFFYTKVLCLILGTLILNIPYYSKLPQVFIIRGGGGFSNSGKGLSPWSCLLNGLSWKLRSGQEALRNCGASEIGSTATHRKATSPTTSPSHHAVCQASMCTRWLVMIGDDWWWLVTFLQPKRHPRVNPQGYDCAQQPLRRNRADRCKYLDVRGRLVDFCEVQGIPNPSSNVLPGPRPTLMSTLWWLVYLWCSYGSSNPLGCPLS